MHPEVRKLSFLPNPLPLYAKALFKRTRYRDGQVIAGPRMSWHGFRFSSWSVQAYAKVCSLACLPGEVPLLFPHSFFGPVHLAMLTDADFPLRVLGGVHTRNHVLQQRPLRTDTVYDAELYFTETRRRRQGIEVDFRTEIRCESGLVWESLTTFLFRQKVAQEDSESPYGALFPRMAVADPVAEFAVPLWAGKAFGLITKDINPIHMSRLLAKAFGFSRDICHGMWALARALPLFYDAASTAAVRVDAAFKGPLFVGDHITICRDSKADVTGFYCAGSDRPAVVVLARPVAKGVRL